MLMNLMLIVNKRYMNKSLKSWEMLILFTSPILVLSDKAARG